MKASEVMAVVELAKEFMPVIKEVAPLIRELGTELKPLIEEASEVMTDMRLRTINRYEKAGMTHEEAVLLTINSSVSLAEALKNARK